MNDEIQRLKDEEAQEIAMGNAEGVLKEKMANEQLKLSAYIEGLEEDV